MNWKTERKLIWAGFFIWVIILITAIASFAQEPDTHREIDFPTKTEPMKFPKYLLATNHYAFPDEELIICTEHPYYTARVMKFKHDWKATEFMSNSDQLIKVRVPGYNMFLYWTGSIRGGRTEIVPTFEAGLTKILKEMAVFYLTEKTAKNPHSIKKYRIYGEADHH